jgi:hypothetical protein
VSDVVSVNYVAGSVDEVPNMGGQFADPDAIAGGTCC